MGKPLHLGAKFWWPPGCEVGAAAVVKLTLLFRILGAVTACVYAGTFGASAKAHVLEISDDGTKVYENAIGAGVLEIGSDGVVAVRDRSGSATWRVLTDRQELAQVTQIDLPEAAISGTAPSFIPDRYAAHVERAAVAASISPALLSALVWQESRWNTNAVSPKGAIGLTQLMPATARELGVNPKDPVANLFGGARYLRAMLDAFGGNVEHALAAYNAGPGRVRRAKGIPAIRETRSYVSSIVERLAATSIGESR